LLISELAIVHLPVFVIDIFFMVVFVPSLSQKWAGMGRLSLEAGGLDNLLMGDFDSVGAKC